MEYKLKVVKDEDTDNENTQRGYKLYEDGNRYYRVWVENGIPDSTSWVSLLPYSGESDMPIFTKEYCEYHGYDRSRYDTVTIID